MRLLIITAAATLAAGCNSPPATQPEDFDTVNATQTDPGVAPGALGEENVSHPEGNITPAERQDGNQAQAQSPLQVAQAYAELLELRRFDDAYAMWDPGAADFSADHFKRELERLVTINSEVGRVGATEGAAGSLYSTVQLTLSGDKINGESYVLTGPVTLRRVNDVPGSTPEQRRWRIVKMQLTADPRKADAIVQQ